MHDTHGVQSGWRIEVCGLPGGLIEYNIVMQFLKRRPARAEEVAELVVIAATVGLDCQDAVRSRLQSEWTTSANNVIADRINKPIGNT